MKQTTMINAAQVNKRWYLIDATNVTLGELATVSATILRGKNKPTFTPHVDCGDNIVIINSDKLILTGNKLNNKKYYRHSLHPGGLKVTIAKDLLKNNSVRMVNLAVKGMLPKTKLGAKQLKNLFVYRNTNHKQEAQKPEPYPIKAKGAIK